MQTSHYVIIITNICVIMSTFLFKNVKRALEQLLKSTLKNHKKL